MDGLREVKESIHRLSLDVNGQLSRLPDLYVPRRELEHRYDEHTLDIGELRVQVAAGITRHEADVRRLTDVIEGIEGRREQEREEDAQQRERERKEDAQQREMYRRWLVGLAVPTILTLVGLAIAVLTLMGRVS